MATILEAHKKQDFSRISLEAGDRLPKAIKARLAITTASISSTTLNRRFTSATIRVCSAKGGWIFRKDSG